MRKRKGWEKKRTEYFRIIREGLSFSRFSSHRPRKRDFTSRIFSSIMKSPEDSPEWALAKTRERCSPCEHARDTDGTREWRESLNQPADPDCSIDQWRRSGSDVAMRDDFTRFQLNNKTDRDANHERSILPLDSRLMNPSDVSQRP